MRILLVKGESHERDFCGETYVARTLAQALSTLNHKIPFDIAIVDAQCVGEDGVRLLSAAHPDVEMFVYASSEKDSQRGPTLKQVVMYLRAVKAMKSARLVN